MFSWGGARLCCPFLSRSCAHQLRDTDDVVGGGTEGEGPSDFSQAPELRLSHAGHRFHPSEPLLDALADALARRVAGMPGGTPVDG